jgi:hypothetical protein
VVTITKCKESNALFIVVSNMINCDKIKAIEISKNRKERLLKMCTLKMNMIIDMNYAFL